MKIAFIGTKGINLKDKSFGGFETVITHLAPHIVKLGDEVYVYCRKQLYNYKQYPKTFKGVKLYFFPSIETKNLGTMTNSFLAILHAIVHRVDVIFLFNIGLGIFVPFIKLFNIKVVTNLDGIEWQREKWGKFAKLIFYFGAFLNTRFANYLIADSEVIQKEYKNKFGADTVFISYGAEIMSNLSPNLIENKGIVKNQYYLLATRFVAENNPLYIIENFSKTDIDKNLIVLGRNYYNSDYENRIKNIKDDRIKFVGHINNRKLLYEYYYYSYCYIHGHSAGGTNPALLEALANSCCVLALDTPFNREVLSSETYGVYFDKREGNLESKLKFLDSNPDIVNKYRKINKNLIIDKYNWSNVNDAYIKLLNDLRNENID